MKTLTAEDIRELEAEAQAKRLTRAQEVMAEFSAGQCDDDSTD